MVIIKHRQPLLAGETEKYNKIIRSHLSKKGNDTISLVSSKLTCWQKKITLWLIKKINVTKRPLQVFGSFMSEGSIGPSVVPWRADGSTPFTCSYS